MSLLFLIAGGLYSVTALTLLGILSSTSRQLEKSGLDELAF